MTANHYLLVWASGKDRRNPAGQLHTNFKIAKEGGYLALVDPHTNVISVFNPYLRSGRTSRYGLDRTDPSFRGFFVTPTPGAQNSTTGEGFAAPPVFSIETGIYTNATLSLTISSVSGTIRYTTDGSVPTASSTAYSGPIVFGTNVTIKARVYASSAELFPSEVVAKSYLFLDDSTVGFNSNLPLLIISTEGRTIFETPSGGNRAKGSLTVIDVERGKSSLLSTPQYLGVAAFELFGQNDINFPKKPYRIEVQDALGNDVKIPILGMPAEADWELRNSYNDKTLLNDFLGTEIFEQMGHYSLRRRLVELFVNTGGGRLNYASNYSGVMTLFEKIEQGKDRVDIAKLGAGNTNEPSITGGYIFKKDKTSPGDFLFSTAGGGGFGQQNLLMHEPKPNDWRITPGGGPLTTSGSNQLAWLRKYLNSMEGALYASNWLSATGTNHWSHYLDADSFADYQLLVEFTKQIDGYRLSTFFHKDRDGKLKAGPVWDWDHSFGDCNFLDGGHTNAWYYEMLGDTDHAWLRRLITGTPTATTTEGDPEFVQLIADKWGVYRTNLLNGPRLLAEIDDLSLRLTNAAARNHTQYPTLGQYVWPQPGVPEGGGVAPPDRPWDVDYVHPTQYMGTSNSIIANMKRWLQGRYLWMDGQFTTPPSISTEGGSVTNGSTVTLRAASGAEIYYTIDGTDPRGPGGTTNGLHYTGPITVAGNMKIVARARASGSWQNTWSGPSTMSFYSATPPLRITEIMFHPASPVGTSASFQYIEVQNIASTPLNVNRFSIDGAVTFQFPNVVLQAGQRALVVKSATAFQGRYGSGALVLGEFSGEWSQTGGHLELRGPAQEPILDFSYSEKWYPATDGFGFSLVTVDEHAPTQNWGLASNWRPSSLNGGSPGSEDGQPPARGPILINEALSHADAPLVDSIELFNPSGSSVDVSGWFLSDEFANPKKYVLGPNTVIPPHGFLVLNEDTSFNQVGAANRFALSSRGDSVWLFSGDGQNLTGYAHGFDFGPAPNGVSFGRYAISTGEEHFVLQTSRTPGGANSGPLVGPLVISEINHHAAAVGIDLLPYQNTMDQYLELQNITGAPVSLFDPANPNHTWRLSDAVDYSFPPTNVVVPPGGFILVIGFDPNRNAQETADFRERNGIPGTVPLFGPWSGDLAASGASIELTRPDAPEADGSVPYIRVDRVDYSRGAPWPRGADGTGLTLQRLTAAAYGNDPANWVALTPSAGGSAAPSGIAPSITSSPSSRVVPTYQPLLLSVTATGSAPLRYQWQVNGLDLAGATNSVLSISNFQPNLRGVWDVVAYNSAGSALSAPFTLTPRTGLRILSQTAGTFTPNGTSTNLNVVIEGTGFLRYHWKFNGAEITGRKRYGNRYRHPRHFKRPAGQRRELHLRSERRIRHPGDPTGICSGALQRVLCRASVEPNGGGRGFGDLHRGADRQCADDI